MTKSRLFAPYSPRQVITIYTIGDFSKLSKISPRMLRHYDKLGLLRPKYVEKDTGYRYYTDEEMHTISTIKKLRRYQFSLKEIKSILEQDDSQHTKEMLENQIVKLLQSASEYNTIISELQKESRVFSHASPYEYDIMLGNRREQRVLCARAKTSLTELSTMITDLLDYINGSDTIVATGVYMVIFHDIFDRFEVFNPACSDVEVCIPVNTDIIAGPYYARKIDEGLYISTIYIGNYDLIGNAYVALLKWARENHYTVTGPPIERCYKDSLSNCSPDDYVTEISFPVKCIDLPDTYG